MSIDILDTLPSFPMDGPPPVYEAGWVRRIQDGQGCGYEAFLRPYSEDWYDLYHFSTWWQAAAKAIDLAQRMPCCEFIGGPPFGGDA